MQWVQVLNKTGREIKRTENYSNFNKQNSKLALKLRNAFAHPVIEANEKMLFVKLFDCVKVRHQFLLRSGCQNIQNMEMLAKGEKFH